MPTYDYVCKSCEHAFEHFQTMTSPLLEECPSCGEKALKRLIGTGGALIFKGSGFYCTDYKPKKSDKPASESKSSDASSSDTASSSSSSSSSSSGATTTSTNSSGD